MDLSKPNDGEIVLCQEALVLNKGASLQFEGPATVYLIGPPVRLSLLGQVPHETYQGAGLYGQSAASGLSGVGAVRLVVPEWANKPGALVFNGGRFSGSIWAPKSNVGMYSTNPNRAEARASFLYAVGSSGWLPTMEAIAMFQSCRYGGICSNSDRLDPSRIVANFIFINNECYQGCPQQFTFPPEFFGGSAAPPSTSSSSEPSKPKVPPLVSWTN